ncbi:PDZ domain-containing protein [Microbacterium sp. LRZ72]|uniref:YlbL family protein n=1 Tax=Microbacterium sp. LRZ72 TaxID=2942481 RepID=UPI0029A60552|nr:S16 family serine protease [Microbacterium sp. LRZ72]MDX2375734.1 PDZ domain-containing protein [Microbacterium sp. LRZ72]
MALFDENASLGPASRAERRTPRRRGARIGYAAMAIALVALAAMSFLPSGSVIQQPGPVYDTLGTAETADGEQVPLIQVTGAETYETEGQLDLTTVQVVGNRQQMPSWLELVGAWFDPSRAVVPVDSVFPAGQTTEQRSEQNAAMMVDSQQEATAAALTELGYDVDPRVRVYAVPEESPAEGILQTDDIILTADGIPVDLVDDLREVIQDGDGDVVAIEVERDGEPVEVEVEPVYDEASESWLVGVSIIHDYTFPIDVTIELDNVGGPSAGLMFALGIVDTLTPEEVTGGEHVAGTGTISADGEVGPIGGIRQKLYGARADGATWFLAPSLNCDEVAGHVPDGMDVVEVETLDDAVAALDVIASGGDTDALPSCEAA